MNKTELTKVISEETGLSREKSAAALNAFLDTISNELAAGREVALIGFGTFEVRERAERQGKNPQTGAPITIAATKVPAFKAGKALKDAVNG